ncbi:MAG: efflux RND transporter periplasmic adaptor subunit [Bryobacteraceae bacterium]
MKKVLIAILVIVALGAWFGYRRWLAPKAAGSGQEQRILYYHCPMHPDYHSDKQGDCPICGMRLTPVYAGEPSLAAPSGQIHISPERQQLIGVQVGEASMVSASRTIRAVGRVALDETRVVKIHPRVDGWIEAVYGDFLGQLVAKGQPLVRIYSPELAATQQEYLLALRSQQIMQHSSMPGVVARSGSLVQAARRRLELWDLSGPQIEELDRTRKPSATITLFAPASGHVIARNAYEKQRVTPETELYTLADLTRVWVMADVFENDIPAISPGQSARVVMTYAGGKSYPARVDYIQPSLDPATRTLKVRLEVDNPGLALKPEMFADVEFRVNLPPRLMVPSDAVLDSGLAKTVFVSRGDGYFEPRRVETGSLAEDKVEILSGLSPGERIVTSGTFLIDSESQIKAAARGMGQHDQHNH